MVENLNLGFTISNSKFSPARALVCGGFHTPKHTQQADLLSNFLYDNRNGWLGAIGFGASFAKPTQAVVEAETAEDAIGQAATATGVPRDILEHFANNAEAQEEFNRWREKRKQKPKPPKKEPTNEDLRRGRVAEEAVNSAFVERLVLERQIRPNWDVIREARTKMIEWNTNDESQVVCQICSEEMPFKLDDGSYYFEAIECVKGLSREIPQNHLALCPVCAAKYKHANGTTSEELQQRILPANGSEVPVTLAREQSGIVFTKVHLLDLQAALRAIGS